VAFVALRYPQISFLWHNVVGVAVVSVSGCVVVVSLKSVIAWSPPASAPAPRQAGKRCAPTASG